MTAAPVPLAEAHDETRFGGKAVGLGAAIRAGLPVPPGFAIATDAVEEIVQGNAEAAAGIARHDLGAMAVRSSAVGEDSGAASFAGQHLTCLNIRDDAELARAIVDIWHSAHGEAASAYRRKMGIEGAPAIGVVVQKLVIPDCAGVLFTRDPVTGAQRRLIEASWGFGEAVVSGLVTPDSYRAWPHGQVESCIPGEKDRILQLSPDGGLTEAPVDAARAAYLCLGDEQLAALNDLAKSCENAFGPDQDIEWAFAADRLYLLQCRSMTAARN